MKVIVFGSTGGTGPCLVRESPTQGHEFTVIVRSQSGLAVSPQQALTVVSADIMSPDVIAPSLDCPGCKPDSCHHPKNREGC